MSDFTYTKLFEQIYKSAEEKFFEEVYKAGETKINLTPLFEKIYLSTVISDRSLSRLSEMQVNQFINKVLDAKKKAEKDEDAARFIIPTAMTFKQALDEGSDSFEDNEGNEISYSLFIDKVYQAVSKRTDISIASATNFLVRLMDIVGIPNSDSVVQHEQDFFVLHPELNYHKKKLI